MTQRWKQGNKGLFILDEKLTNGPTGHGHSSSTHELKNLHHVHRSRAPRLVKSNEFLEFTLFHKGYAETYPSV